MDLITIIIGVALIAACIIPFLMMYKKRVGGEGRSLKTLKEMAEQHNCAISKHEFCGDFVMGIDQNRNFVFFVKQKKEEAISQFVDLSGVQICQAVKKTRAVESDNETVSVIERIELFFSPNKKNISETTLELFDDNINMRLSGEFQFADEWSRQINDCLKR
jgi:hypothetical protein